MIKENDSIKKEILMAGVFQQMPQLLNPVRENLRDIFDIIREYSPRRKYDTTHYAYSAIVAVVDKYFKVKKRSTDYADIFGGQTDKFLIHIFEELTGLSKISIDARDLQGTLQVMQCFQLIAIRAISFPPIVENSDNFTCSLAAGYLKGIILDGLNVGMEDVGLEGIRILKDIESKLPAEYSFTTRSLIDYINDIAFKSLLKYYIIDEAISALVKIYKARVDFRPRSTLGKHILDKIQVIAKYYVQFNPQVSVNCEGLGAAFSVIREDSLPILLIQDLPNILKDKKYEVFRDIFHLYLAVGEEAAKRDSFLIHFIIQSINSIINAAIDYVPKNSGIEEQKKVFSEITWLASVYWNIYQNQPQEYKSQYIELTGIDNLVALTLKSIKTDLRDLAEKLTGQVFSLVSVGQKKPLDEYRVPRLLVHAIKIGAVARARQMNSIADQVLDQAVKEFFFHLARYKPEQIPKNYFEEKIKESLSREMWQLYLEYSRRESRSSSPFDSDYFFYGMITRDQIKNYLNEIEKKFYNRTIDDVYETFGVPF